MMTMRESNETTMGVCLRLTKVSLEETFLEAKPAAACPWLALQLFLQFTVLVSNGVLSFVVHSIKLV